MSTFSKWVTTKYQDPETGEFYYGIYGTAPKEKHLPRTYTSRLASDGSPYLTVMVPDEICGYHPIYGEYIEFFPIFDVHFGHRGCHEDYFDETISRIATRPYSFWWGGGDLTENSGRHSIGGGIYEQILPPQKQQDKMIEKLKPIAHKSWLFTRGNHGYRSYKEVGLDPDLNIANAFDIPYFIGQYHIDVNWRGKVWSIVGYHGKGKGSSPKSRMEALIRTARMNEIADFHVMGHMHHRMNIEFTTAKRNRKTGVLDGFKTRAILFGGFLKYWNEYCDENAMDMTSIGTYSVGLLESGKHFIQEEDYGV